MIQAGTYIAKVASHAITETKGGDPQAAITFKFTDSDDKQQTLTYFGSFKEKARPFTLKALLACGLKGNNPAGPLEIGKEVSIVVEHEDGQDGKTRSKIKWVNQISGVKNVIDPTLAKSKLADLEGAIMAARQEHGVADTGAADEIPF